MEYLPFSTAIRLQPAALRQAIEHIESSLHGAELAPWKVGDTVAVLAMGASTNTSHVLCAALTRSGVRSTNVTPNELLASPPEFQPGDHYVVVSESGRSPEPLALAARVAQGNRIGVTNFPNQAISKVVDTVVSLGELEDSAVYSTGYVATLAAYSFLLRCTGHAALATDERALPGLIESGLEQAVAVAPQIARHLAAASSIDVVGHAASFAGASEGALMFREGLGIPGAAFDTFQYLHGPAESASASSGVIMLGDGRELVLAAELAAAGVPVVVITAATAETVEPAESAGAMVVRVAPADSIPRAIAEVVALQAIIEAISLDRGTSIETFNYSQADTKVDEV